MQDLLVGSSAVFSNGNVADERIFWEIRFGKLRDSRSMLENQAKVVWIW